MPELQQAELFNTTFNTNNYMTVRDNADIGVVRMKSLHIDMCFSPNASAIRPIGINCTLHRVHSDVGTANLVETEGSRVKFERLTVGSTTDRYYRMWLKQINLEFGYKLILHLDPEEIVGGTPSFGIFARWWELTPDTV